MDSTSSVSVLLDAKAFDDNVRAISVDERLLAAWSAVRNGFSDPSLLFPAARIVTQSSSSYVVTFQLKSADRDRVFAAFAAHGVKIVRHIVVGPLPQGYKPSSVQNVIRFRCPSAVVAFRPGDKYARITVPEPELAALLTFTHFVPGKRLRFRELDAYGNHAEVFGGGLRSPAGSPRVSPPISPPATTTASSRLLAPTQSSSTDSQANAATPAPEVKRCSPVALQTPTPFAALLACAKPSTLSSSAPSSPKSPRAVPAQPSESDDSDTETIYQCDGCEAEPIGPPLFVCGICEDYHLCEKCYRAGVHRDAGHPFELLARDDSRYPIPATSKR